MISQLLCAVVLKKIDDQLQGAGVDMAGTTATIALVRNEKHEKVLYIANVGDSKAIIVTQNGTEQTTYDHKGTDQSEIDRIVSEGGFILRGRVGGQLAVTRALGDHHLKSCGVSNEPYVVRRVLSDKDLFLVMASDGLWDVVSEEELKLLKYQNSLDISRTLLEKAMNQGTQDNVCILSLILN